MGRLSEETFWKRNENILWWVSTVVSTSALIFSIVLGS
jgi:hypothetical protein